MRENLYHGKRKDNGEWVEGCLLGNDLIVPKGQPFYVCRCILDSALTIYEVIPETVGQYTELPDKNGKKIFEGDICKVTVFTCEGEDKHFLCEVCFDYSSFIFRERSGLDILFSDICDFDTDVEVIGNIYDNPELIGGRTNE